VIDEDTTVERIYDMTIERWSVDTHGFGKLLFSYLCFSAATEGMKVVAGAANGFFSGQPPTGCVACQVNLATMSGLLATDDDDENFEAILKHEEGCILEDFPEESVHPSVYGEVLDVLIQPVNRSGDYG